MVMGTQAYMSPEQRAGRSAGRPTDIYSIAVMTLETLARLGPPRTGATSEWAKQALQRIVPNDSELGVVFGSALADVPEARIQEAGELARRLSQAIRAEKPILASITKSEDAVTLGLDEATTE
jgi:serine/threonine protein kinase